MDALFLRILNMSIAASWVILAVVLLRLALRKAPKWVSCLLWVLVGLRLLIPFSIESMFSILPSAETIPLAVIQPSVPSFQLNSGVAVIDRPVNSYLADRYFEGVTVPAANGSNVMTVLGCCWLAGALLMLCYMALSYLVLRRKVAVSAEWQPGVYLCDHLRSPFILGLVKPRIYLPSEMEEEKKEYVLAHERSHLRRRDHYWKPLGFFVLAIHWFNPLVWVGYILLCRDIELACDEKVVKGLDEEGKKHYSLTLLGFAQRQRPITVCPLAFGEVGVKERVKSVLSYKKPTFWILLVAVAVLIAATVMLLTDPPKTADGEKEGEQQEQIGLSFAGLTPEKRVLSEQYFEVTESATWQYQLTYSSATIRLEIGLLEEDGTEIVRTVMHGSATGLVENIPAGRYRIFVENAGCVNDLPGIAVESGAMQSTIIQDGEAVKGTEQVLGVSGMICEEAGYFPGDMADWRLWVQDGQLWLKNVSDEITDADYTWKPAEQFEEITLSEDNFDRCFRDETVYVWVDDYTVQQMREDTVSAYRALDGYKILYLLEQKNGEQLLSFGYIGAERGSISRIGGVYRLSDMADVASPSTAEAWYYEEYDPIVTTENWGEAPEVMAIAGENAREIAKKMVGGRYRVDEVLVNWTSLMNTRSYRPSGGIYLYQIHIVINPDESRLRGDDQSYDYYIGVYRSPEGRYYNLGYISQQQIEATYVTKEMHDLYGDSYAAAVTEMFAAWETDFAGYHYKTERTGGIPALDCEVILDGDLYKQIKVKNTETGELIQTLELDENQVFAGALLYVTDVTFDGLPELIVPKYSSAYAGYFDAYTWQNGRFVPVEGFCEIANPAVDGENRQILSYQSGGRYTYYCKYRWEKGAFCLDGSVSWGPATATGQAGMCDFAEIDGDHNVVYQCFLVPFEEGLCCDFDENDERVARYFAPGKVWDLRDARWDAVFFSLPLV